MCGALQRPGSGSCSLTILVLFWLSSGVGELAAREPSARLSLCDNGPMSTVSVTALRGALAAVFATGVALLSHLIAGGAAPGVTGVVIPLVLAVAVCVLLIRVRWDVARLSLSVGLSQLLFHLFFSWSAGHGTAALGVNAPGRGTEAAAGHLGHAGAMPMTSGQLDAMTASMSDAMAAGGHATGAAMWCAHVVAAIATAFVLHRGEQIERQLRVWAQVVARWVTPQPAPALATSGWVRRVLVEVGPRLIRRSSGGFDLMISPWRGPPATAWS